MTAMLQKWAAGFLSSTVGKYIKEINPENLKLKVYSGNVELDRLELNPNAFLDLDIPVEVVAGGVGRIVLEIPWGAFAGGASPVKVVLEDVYVLVVPKRAQSEEQHRAWQLRHKQHLLDIADARDSSGMEAVADAAQADAGFTASLLTTIGDNVQVAVKRLHIRYEDEDPQGTVPNVAAGIMLDELTVQSCDSAWRAAFVAASDWIYKLGELRGLGVYWDTGSSYRSLREEYRLDNYDTVERAFRSLAAPDPATGRQWLLVPVNASVKASYARKRGVPGLDRPPDVAIDFNVHDGVKMRMEEMQYESIVSVAGLLNTQAQLAAMQEQHVDETATFTEQEQRAYAELIVKRKSNGGKLDDADLAVVNALERSMPFRELRRLRQAAFKKYKENEEAQAARAPKPQASWFGGWLPAWGASTPEVNPANDPDLQMSQEEKDAAMQEIINTIGYVENAEPASKLPVDHQVLRVEVNVPTVTLEMITGGHTLLEASIISTYVTVLQRPFDLDVQARVGELTAQDRHTARSLLPNVLQSSKNPVSDERTPRGEAFYMQFVRFDKLPVEFHQRDPIDVALEVRLAPIEVVAGAPLIERLIAFFNLEANPALDRVYASYQEQMSGLRRAARTALDMQTRIKLAIDVAAPHILIPEDPARLGSEVLFIDLGHLTAKSRLPNTLEPPTPPPHFAIAQADDPPAETRAQYNIDLTRVSIAVSELGSQAPRGVSASSVLRARAQLLDPLNVELDVRDCVSLMENGERDTKLFVRAAVKLPLLRVSMSSSSMLTVTKLMRQLSAATTPKSQTPVPIRVPVQSGGRVSPDVLLSQYVTSPTAGAGAAADDDEFFDAEEEIRLEPVRFTAWLDIDSVVADLVNDANAAHPMPVANLTMTRLACTYADHGRGSTVSLVVGGLRIVDTTPGVKRAFEKVLYSEEKEHLVRVDFEEIIEVDSDNELIRTNRHIKMDLGSLVLNVAAPTVTSAVAFAISAGLVGGDRPVAPARPAPVPRTNSMMSTLTSYASNNSAVLGAGVGGGLLSQSMLLSPDVTAPTLDISGGTNSPSTNVTVTASFRKLTVVVFSELRQLLNARMGELTLSLQSDAHKIVLDGKLDSLRLDDPTPGSCYANILSTAHEGANMMHLSVHIPKYGPPTEMDPTALPRHIAEVTLNVGSISVVVLNAFLQDVINEAAAFTAALAPLTEGAVATPVAVDTAPLETQGVDGGQLPVVLVEFKSNHPIITIPMCSTSRAGVRLDLGATSVRNQLKPTEDNARRLLGIDEWAAKVAGMDVQLSHDGDRWTPIVNKFSLSIAAERPLLADLTDRSLLVYTKATLSPINVRLRRDEYLFLGKLFTSNFSETRRPQASPSVQPAASATPPTGVALKINPNVDRRASVASSQKTVVAAPAPGVSGGMVVSFDVAFSMPSLKLELNNMGQSFLAAAVTDFGVHLTYDGDTVAVSTSLKEITLEDRAAQGLGHADGPLYVFSSRPSHDVDLTMPGAWPDLIKVNVTRSLKGNASTMVDATFGFLVVTILPDTVSRLVAFLEPEERNTANIVETVRPSHAPTPATPRASSIAASSHGTPQESPKDALVARINVSVAAVAVVLVASNGQRLAGMRFASSEVSVEARGDGVAVEGNLGEISVEDKSPFAGQYSCILLMKKENSLKFKFRGYDRQALSYPGHDSDLSLEMHNFKVYFLMRFTMKLAEFFEDLAARATPVRVAPAPSAAPGTTPAASPAAPPARASPVASNAPTPMLQRAAANVVAHGVEASGSGGAAANDGPQRMKMHIQLVNPLIVIPRNSQSRHVITVDLGHIRVTNEFTTSHGLPADAMRVSMRAINARASTMGAEEEPTDRILSDTNLELNITSFLVASPDDEAALPATAPRTWLTCVVDEEVRLHLTKAEYNLLMGIIMENMNEVLWGFDTAPTTTVTTAEATTTLTSEAIKELLVDQSARAVLQARPADQRVAVQVRVNVNVAHVSLTVYQDVAGNSNTRSAPLAAIHATRLGLHIDSFLAGNCTFVSVTNGELSMRDARAGHREAHELLLVPLNVAPTTSQVEVHVIYVGGLSGGVNMSVALAGLSVTGVFDVWVAIAEFATPVLTPDPINYGPPCGIILPPQPQTRVQMTINLSAVELSALASYTLENSEALVLKFGVDVAVGSRDIQESERALSNTQVHAAITDLQVFSCALNNRAATMAAVIEPTLINVDVNVDGPPSRDFGLPAPAPEIRVSASVSSLAVAVSYRDFLLAVSVLTNLPTPSANAPLELTDASASSNTATALAPRPAAATAPPTTSSASRPPAVQVHVAMEHAQLKLLNDLGGAPIPVLEVTLTASGGARTGPSNGVGNGDCDVHLAANYFNQTAGVWEALVEPYRLKVTGDMKDSNLDVAVNSEQRFHINLTHQTLDTLVTTTRILTRDFYALTDAGAARQAYAAHVIRNFTGMPVTLTAHDTLTSLKPNDEIPLQLPSQLLRSSQHTHGPLEATIDVDGSFVQTPKIQVDKAGSYAFKLQPTLGAEYPPGWLFCDVEFRGGGCYVVTLSSGQAVINDSGIPLTLGVRMGIGEAAPLTEVLLAHGQGYAAPLLHAATVRMYVKPTDNAHDWCPVPLAWSEPFPESGPVAPYSIACPSLGTAGATNLYLAVISQPVTGVARGFRLAHPQHPAHKHVITPPLVLHNRLPGPLEYEILDDNMYNPNDGKDVVQTGYLLSNARTFIYACPGGRRCWLRLRIEGFEYFSAQVPIEPVGDCHTRPEISSNARVVVLDCDVRSDERALRVASVHVRHWLVNKTGWGIAYTKPEAALPTNKNARIVGDTPIMIGKRDETPLDLCFRIGNTDWSLPNRLVPGSTANVQLQDPTGQPMLYDFIVSCEYGSQHLFDTTVVTLRPAFAVVNMFQRPVSLRISQRGAPDMTALVNKPVPMVWRGTEPMPFSLQILGEEGWLPSERIAPQSTKGEHLLSFVNATSRERQATRLYTYEVNGTQYLCVSDVAAYSVYRMDNRTPYEMHLAEPKGAYHQRCPPNESIALDSSTLPLKQAGVPTNPLTLTFIGAGITYTVPPAAWKSTPGEQALPWIPLGEGLGIRMDLHSDGPSTVLRATYVNSLVETTGTAAGSPSATEVRVSVNLAGLGLSVIARNPRKELVYAELSGLEATALVHATTVTLRAQIGHVQLDNNRPNDVFPVALCSPRGTPWIVVQMITGREATTTRYFDSLQISVAPTAIALTLETVLLWQDQVEAALRIGGEAVRAEGVIVTELEGPPDAATTLPLYFRTLVINKVKLRVSFRMDVAASKEAKAKLPSLLRVFGPVIANTDDLNLTLPEVTMSSRRITAPLLGQQIGEHYSNASLLAIAQVVGSLDVLGNPAALLRDIRQGVSDAVSESRTGASAGAVGMVTGVSRGGSSLVRHTVHGVATSASRITGAIERGLEGFSMDSQYAEQRQRERQNATSAGGMFASGVTGMLGGVVSGVAGLVTKPVEGARENGVAGLFKGVGKGVVGLIAKPLGGVVGMVSATTQSVATVAHHKAAVKRLRVPRYVPPSGPLPPYSSVLAVAYANLPSMPGDEDLDEETVEARRASEDILCAVYGVAKSLVVVTRRRMVQLVALEGGDYQVAWYAPCSRIKQDGVTCLNDRVVQVISVNDESEIQTVKLEVLVMQPTRDSERIDATTVMRAAQEALNPPTPVRGVLEALMFEEGMVVAPYLEQSYLIERDMRRLVTNKQALSAMGMGKDDVVMLDRVELLTTMYSGPYVTSENAPRDIKLYSALIGLDAKGALFYRQGVRWLQPEGTGWVAMDGDVVDVAITNAAMTIWAASKAGALLWREGITPRQPIGTVWQELPAPGLVTALTATAFGLWVVVGGAVHVRVGVTPHNPHGDAWRRLKWNKDVVRLSASRAALWVQTADGKMWYRRHSSLNPIGEDFMSVENFAQDFAASETGVWIINPYEIVMHRDLPVPGEPLTSGKWVEVDGRLQTLTCGRGGALYGATGAGMTFYRAGPDGRNPGWQLLPDSKFLRLFAGL